MRPTGNTPRDVPGRTNGVGEPAAAAASCAAGFPARYFGSVRLPAVREKTPATNDDSVEERVVLTTWFVMGFVAEMDIRGTRRG
jgi:hypothetical protein